MEFEPGEQLQEFIALQISTGRFHNATEVVVEGLRRLKKFEDGETARYASLVQESRARGGFTSVDVVLDQLEEKYSHIAGSTDIA